MDTPTTWLICGGFISKWINSIKNLRYQSLLKYGSYLVKQDHVGGLRP